MKIRENGFTLVELLVVVAIIGILMSITVPKISNAITKAKEAQCETNLRQLHAAAISYANEHSSQLPYAQSHEVYDRVNQTYSERRGWIAWSNSSCNIDDLEKNWKSDKSNSSGLNHDNGAGKYAKFGVENGTLFTYMNESLSHYVCPIILAAKGQVKSFDDDKKTVDIHRTYAMNGFFGSEQNRKWYGVYVTRVGQSEYYSKDVDDNEKSFKPESSRLLLFTEIAPSAINDSTYSGTDPIKGNKDPASTSGDCFLAPTGEKDNTDRCAAVHTSPVKGQLTSYAVFLDGHIDKIYANHLNENDSPDGKNTVWYYCRGLSPDQDVDNN